MNHVAMWQWRRCLGRWLSIFLQAGDCCPFAMRPRRQSVRTGRRGQDPEHTPCPPLLAPLPLSNPSRASRGRMLKQNGRELSPGPLSLLMLPPAFGRPRATLISNNNCSVWGSPGPLPLLTPTVAFGIDRSVSCSPCPSRSLRVVIVPWVGNKGGSAHF